MATTVDKHVPESFSFLWVCGTVAKHWPAFSSGSRLRLDMTHVKFLDPSAVALTLLVDRYFPKMISLENLSVGHAYLVDRIKGRQAPGTIFPAHGVAGYLDGTMLIRLRQWISFILASFYGAPQNRSAEFVELSAVELINNVIDHSEAENGGMIVAASFEKRKHFELSVMDFGKSIPGTLSFLYDGLSDEELIAKSLEFGVSRRYGSEHNYGRGLDIVTSYALRDPECSVLIASRDGFVSITAAKLHVRRSNFRFPGTIVKCGFSKTFVEHHLAEEAPAEDLEW